jgi:hypothetical protein
MSNVWFHILLIAAIAASLITSATSSAQAQDVEDNLSVFKSPEAEARYLEAYCHPITVACALRIPVHSTRFGVTHVIASGPKGCSSTVVLLHAATPALPSGSPTPEICRSCRIYAWTPGDAGMSKVDSHRIDRITLYGYLMSWTG